MASIEQCRHNIQRYKELKIQLKAIIARLDTAESATGRLDLDIASSFKVNGDSALITNRTTTLKRKIDDTSSYLRNTVLPAIDSSIEDERDTIDYLEEQERKRKEEEERRRREREEAGL